MTPIEVVEYVVNGIAWFLAGMYTNTIVMRRKDRREHLSR